MICFPPGATATRSATCSDSNPTSSSTSTNPAHPPPSRSSRSCSRQLVPGRLDALLATGVVEACGPDRYCVPSPSLLQLSIDALAVGLDPDVVLALLASLRAAADTAADAVLDALARIPDAADDTSIAALVARGRGLLAHGVGRLTLHRLGRTVGAGDHPTGDELAAVLRRRIRPADKRKAHR